MKVEKIVSNTEILHCSRVVFGPGGLGLGTLYVIRVFSICFSQKAEIFTWRSPFTPLALPPFLITN